MRLPLIAPDQLNPEQKPLYEDMKRGIASTFNLFKTVNGFNVPAPERD